MVNVNSNPRTRGEFRRRGMGGARFRDGPARSRPVDLGPVSAYEAVTRQMVEGLADDLDEIKGRLNGLLGMLAGAIILDLVLRLGAGG